MKLMQMSQDGKFYLFYEVSKSEFKVYKFTDLRKSNEVEHILVSAFLSQFQPFFSLF